MDQGQVFVDWGQVFVDRGQVFVHQGQVFVDRGRFLWIGASFYPGDAQLDTVVGASGS